MGNVTWKGFVTESTINSVEYGLLCSSNSSTPLEVASPLPLETIPENATIAKAEDLSQKTTITSDFFIHERFWKRKLSMTEKTKNLETIRQNIDLIC